MSTPQRPEDAKRFHPLKAYFQARLGAGARKVPLDAGFSCPNRDGSLSRSGCLFCNPAGSGTGLLEKGLGLAAQWEFLTPRLRARHPGDRLLAYLQSFSNTHGDLDRLRAVLAEISGLPGVAGLCIGTRPDCLDVGPDAGAAGGMEGSCGRLDALAAFMRQDAQASLTNDDAQASGTIDDAQESGTSEAGQGFAAHVAAAAASQRERGPVGPVGPRRFFVQLDLGLQSADDAVLARINRGHDAACFARAARAAAARGISVCAHLVHGLPGAGPDDLERSVDFLNALPVAGVKLHNLLVCRGAGLEGLWRSGAYAPPGREDYVQAVVRALSRLRPALCVQRLAADPAPGELLAPVWGADKTGTLARIRAELARQDTWQGRDGYCPEALPDWGQMPDWDNLAE